MSNYDGKLKSLILQAPHVPGEPVLVVESQPQVQFEQHQISPYQQQPVPAEMACYPSSTP